ncbi:TetR/AcrR family transcriptional regulator [Oceanicoccus sagamiensis]|nr:TetR/AcrR family transcriptional regulator [Oceanicoccus sagamiensis]
MSEKSPSSKKNYHHGNLRKTLLDEAAILLREQGEAGLSMRKLADRVGVSRTAPYHHFKDKRELLCAIAEEGFRQFRLAIHPPELAGSFSIDQQRIRQLVKDYVDFAIGHSEYYDLMFGSHLWKTEGLTETLKEEAYGAFRSYLDGFSAWQGQPAVTADLDPLRFAQVSWGTLHGMSRLLLDGIYVDDKAREAMCEATAQMFWRALRA